jgi:endonuclease VIII
MPEGHTIHRLAKGLRSTLGGTPVAAWSPQGRFSEGAALIDGNPLVRAEAWGKYLFCDFGIGQVLHVHLGLIGKFRQPVVAHDPPRGQIRLRLEGPDAVWDLSGPSRCELLSPDDRDRIVGQLGADPLRRGADPDQVRRAFRSTQRPVGAVVLDQSVIAGIGNVYRAEVLFLAGIHPARPAASLDPHEVDRIWAISVELLQAGVRLGRIVTTDPAEIGRPRSRMTADERLYVYHREVCRRCGSDITTLPIGGRPIWFCPTCQPAS